MTSKKSSNNKETVGAAAVRLRSQGDQKINPIELQREMQKGNKSEDSYESNLLQAIERGKKQYNRKFFVVVLFQKDRLMKNVVRQKFLHRMSCPTPSFDQTVYSYDPINDDLVYHWSIPEPHAVEHFYFSLEKMEPEYRQLAEFCRDFRNGELDRKCAELNGEDYEG